GPHRAAGHGAAEGRGRHRGGRWRPVGSHAHLAFPGGPERSDDRSLSPRPMLRRGGTEDHAGTTRPPTRVPPAWFMPGPRSGGGVAWAYRSAQHARALPGARSGGAGAGPGGAGGRAGGDMTVDATGGASTLAGLVRAERRRRGWSREQLAARAECTAQTVQYSERGRRRQPHG